MFIFSLFSPVLKKAIFFGRCYMAGEFRDIVCVCVFLVLPCDLYDSFDEEFKKLLLLLLHSLSASSHQSSA